MTLWRSCSPALSEVMEEGELTNTRLNELLTVVFTRKCSSSTAGDILLLQDAMDYKGHAGDGLGGTKERSRRDEMSFNCEGE